MINDDQPSLFDAAYARRTDPDTSHIAALTVDATRLERLVNRTDERRGRSIVWKLV